MRKLLFSLAMFLCVSFGFSAKTNFACFIASPSDQITSIKEYNFFVRDYNRASAIFSGKVIELERFKIKFKVEKVWKGDISKEFVMSTGAFPRGKRDVISISSCNYRFELGKSYVVFAQKNHHGNRENSISEKPYGPIPEEYRNLLWASESSRTRRMEEAKIGIKNLNKLFKPKKKRRV